MADQFLMGQPDIALTLRRSARARRITLRISQLDGRVTLTLPRGVSECEALRFADQKAGWIRKHLAARASDVPVGIGQTIPIDGELREIITGKGRSVMLEPGYLMVPGPVDSVPARTLGFLKVLARDRLAQASDHYACRLGRPYTGLSLRDTRSRWGSCSSSGRLMYSWRLILAPCAVLSYVAAHEVAHLAQMNHSPAFWDEVTKIYGPYAEQRRWLREEGGALHRYRFGD